MPRRIVIHAGFHKTGTSTIQALLRDNRAALRPWLRSVLKGQMGDVLSAARGYSTWRDPLTLEKFATRFRALLSGIGAMPRRTLCLSAEELSGHMPGRGALADYSAAPLLADEMIRIAGDLFPQTPVVLFYSTRAPGPWLRSAYWEHVRSSSMTLDWDDFAATYHAGVDLDAVLARIASRHDVQSARLEDSAGLPAGPATPLLKLCGVPEQVITALPAQTPRNERLDDTVLLALLAANRDHPDSTARKAAKQAILAQAKDPAQ